MEKSWEFAFFTPFNPCESEFFFFITTILCNGLKYPQPQPPEKSFCVVTELYKTVLASVPTGKIDVSSIFFLYRKALINWWEQVCWSVLAGVVFLSKGHEKYPQTHHLSVWRADRLVTLEISLQTIAPALCGHKEQFPEEG